MHQRRTSAMAVAESLTALQTIPLPLPTRTPGFVPVQPTRLAAALAADKRDILPSAASWPFHHDAVPKLFAHGEVVILKQTILFEAAFGVKQHIWGDQE